MRVPSRLRGVALVVLWLAGAPSAAAAPQVLGVVATAGPRPLHCAGGECTAYLSTFCIQRERPAPEAGALYRPAPGPQGLILVVTGADGAVSRLPAEEHLRVESYGGYSAVRVSLAEAEAARLGAVAVSVEAGPAASLVPVPVAGDPDPLSETELALATGPLRGAAAALFDRPGSPRADAARLTSLLINALPERGPEAAALRDRLWSAQLARADLAGLHPAGRTRAELGYRACRWQAARGEVPNLRACLRRSHDALMMELNEEFWDQIGGW